MKDAAVSQRNRDQGAYHHFLPPASPIPHPAPSSTAWHLDASSNDLLLQLLDFGAGTVGDECAIAIVVDVADAAFLQSERVDPALEGVVLYPLNHIERRGVHSLHHRRQHVTRRLVVLIGVDADRQPVGGACRLEDTLPGRSGGVEDYFDALVVLTERQLFALARILECVGSDASVLRDH